jgi:hypothetical protein
VLDAVGVALAGGLAGDAQALADRRPGVPGCAHLPYDLVDGRVGVAGHLLGDGDDGIQQGEFVAVSGTDVGRFDELLHSGLFVHADNRRLRAHG